ncbi:MAG TPA: serine/threonine-protein kinase [Urbifossiella sp.]|nr:serine/threonine-protein kinase [Urbifossiella sp.]
MTTTDPVATAPHGLDEGVALALKAQDGGDARPLLDWLARNPHLAAALARFLAAERPIRADIAPVRPAPAVVGGYHVLGELGRGGMGVVYRAFDPDLKREVALKLVPGGDDGRFRFEAEAAARLDHDNVVPVYHVGDDAGVPFLVMKVMEGGSLAAKLKALGRRPHHEAAALVRDVALGVHHAHQRGLLHRDLKPGNVLLDADGRPHVADFGLAKPLDVSVSSTAGTVAYMAPELARGDRALTVAVDVHALGAILYELLTGAPPFGLDDLMAVARRVSDEPAPPVRAARPDCPPDLAAVCARCLEKQPEDRYPTAAALAADLDRFRAGEPVGLRSGWWSQFMRLIDQERKAVPVSNGTSHLWGAAWTFLTQGAAVAAVLAGGGPGWLLAALIANAVGWTVVFTFYVWLRPGRLNSAERVSGAIKFWALVTCAALVPAYWADPLALYPATTAVLAFCILSHAPVHGGRVFYGGLAVLAGAVAMPFLPPALWPAALGLPFGGWALVYGLRMRALDRAARPSS